MPATVNRLVAASPSSVCASPTRSCASYSYACAALIGFAAISLGAVHDWALWPLVAAMIVFGTIGLTSASGRKRWGVPVAIAPVFTAVIIQLVPFPAEVIRSSGSGLRDFLTTYDLGFAADARRYVSLSVSPQLTLRACVILAALTLFIAALEVQLHHAARLTSQLALGIATVALLLAVFALIQKATFNGKIYWFWESQFRANSNYYGPFVNRNHFAGWMLLGVAVTGGSLLGQMQAMARGVKPGWRNRVLWLSSEEASRILLTTAAMLVMLVSIIWSMSRSGMAATAVALFVLSIAALRRLHGIPRKIMATVTVFLLLALAGTWRGTDALANWYGRTQTFEWRIQLWKDTLPALSDFWLAGSGVNTYSRVMLVYSQTDKTVHAAQAHGDYVQLAVEGGLVVGIPTLIVVALLIRQVRRRLCEPQDEMTWWIRIGAVAGMCGMALQETVEFSLQIPAVAVLFAVLIAIAVHESAPPSTRHARLSS